MGLPPLTQTADAATITYKPLTVDAPISARPLPDDVLPPSTSSPTPNVSRATEARLLDQTTGVVRSIIPTALGPNAGGSGPAYVEAATNVVSLKNGNITGMDTQLIEPKLIDITPGLTLAAGCYIVTGATGSGKTAAMIAMTDASNQSGLAAQYMSVFEPRSPKYSTKFIDAANFNTDLAKLAEGIKSQQCLLVLDSVTLPLQAYSSNSNWRYQSTFTGGAQPSSYDFIVKLGALARSRNIVLFAVINEDLVPYVSALYAVAEGIINVLNPAAVTISDRTKFTGRTPKPYNIPIDSVRRSLFSMGFGEYRAQGAQSASLFSSMGLYSRKQKVDYSSAD